PAFQPARALQREEEIVQGEADDIVRRLAPFATRAVEHAEVDAVAEQDVPRMEVAVHPAKASGAAAQVPAPAHATDLDVAQRVERHRAFIGIAVGHAENALAMPEEIAHA